MNGFTEAEVITGIEKCIKELMVFHYEKIPFWTEGDATSYLFHLLMRGLNKEGLFIRDEEWNVDMLRIRTCGHYPNMKREFDIGMIDLNVKKVLDKEGILNENNLTYLFLCEIKLRRPSSTISKEEIEDAINKLKRVKDEGKIKFAYLIFLDWGVKYGLSGFLFKKGGINFFQSGIKIFYCLPGKGEMEKIELDNFVIFYPKNYQDPWLDKAIEISKL
jgi:hypothetical protein